MNDWLVRVIMDKELALSVNEDSGEAKWTVGKAEKLAKAIRNEIKKRRPRKRMYEPYDNDFNTMRKRSHDIAIEAYDEALGLPKEKNDD